MRLFRVSAKTPATWEAVLEEFLLHQQAQGKAPRTVYDYRAWVSRFFRSFPRAWGDYETLRRSVLEHFARLGLMAPATFNLARKYLKVFFAWCVQEGYLPANPLNGIKKRKEEGRPRSIPPDVLRKLLSLPDKNTYTGIRDYALILLQVDTGLRPQEALLLTPSCFNLKMLEVTVPSHVAKTREGRTVVISPQTAKAIQKLLSLRPPDWTEEVPVFASQDGRPMLETSWAHSPRTSSTSRAAETLPCFAFTMRASRISGRWGTSRATVSRRRLSSLPPEDDAGQETDQDQPSRRVPEDGRHVRPPGAYHESVLAAARHQDLLNPQSFQIFRNGSLTA